MVKKIVNGLFYVNTYLIIKGNDCVIVDPGMDLDSEDIKNKYQVKAILITHAHIDHIMGLKDFKGLDVYISGQDLPKLFMRDLSLYQMTGAPIPYKKEDFNFITIKDGDTINLLDTTIKVIATPGHTDGSVCYLYKDILFSGDTLFYHSIGRTDLPGGDYSWIMRSILDKLIPLGDDVHFYPGHGMESTIGHETLYNPFVTEVLNHEINYK